MKILLILSFFMVTLMSCENQSKSTNTTQESTTMATRAPFIHTVFFYLNEDVTDDQKLAFEKGMEKLGTCSTIANYRIGKPAMTPRDIVDNDYGYCWIVEFANAQDQDAYQTDPIHLEFIDAYKDLWKDVKVYDSVMMN